MQKDLKSWKKLVSNTKILLNFLLHNTVGISKQDIEILQLLIENLNDIERSRLEMLLKEYVQIEEQIANKFSNESTPLQHWEENINILPNAPLIPMALDRLQQIKQIFRDHFLLHD